MARKIISCPAPSCGARFDVSKYDPGSRIRCGRCHQVITVPAEDAPAPAPVQAAAAGQTRSPSKPLSAATIKPMSSASVPVRGQPAPRTGTQSGPPPPKQAQQKVALDTPQAAQADPLVGAVLHGQYRLIKKLGEGGYGAVYEAKDVNLERRVAIKVMLQSRAASREYVAKFLREARTAAQLTHTNVVSVHGVGFDREHNVHFLAMEFVQGRTIHDVIQEKGPMVAETAIDYMVQSCKGLQAAHERNIIHRDIKPGNLMITPAGVIKITDFGLAKVYDEAAAQSTVIGTPYFMPPEQFEGKAKDGRTDIYALGVTFYYMLTLQRPHTGAGPAQILLSVMTKEPASILDHRPDLPEGLWPVVRRMIQRDLDKRYSNCNEIIQDLLRLQGGGVEEVEQLYCPACGAGNDLEAEVCASCKESLQDRCPVCNSSDAAGTKFCGNCGSNIPMERAVMAIADEAKALLALGQVDKARDKLVQALERSPQNLAVANLMGELDARREARDAHRDAIRDLLAQGRPQEAMERWTQARKEFPESPELKDLETDVNSALAARDTTGSTVEDALASARKLEADGRVREALVAWRGVMIMTPGSEEAAKGEARTRDRVDQADQLAAEAAAALSRGDPESAEATLTQAVALLPKDPVIAGRLREAQRGVKELDTELKAAENAIKSGPSTAALDHLRVLATRYRGSQRLADAVLRAERAGKAASVGASRDRLDKALSKAMTAEKSHKLRDAAAAYREAASVDPENSEAQEGLARVDRELAEFDALLGQSRAMLQSGDPEGAVAAAQAALAKVEGDTEAKAQLARSRTSLETLKHEAERIKSALGNDADEDVLNWARDLSARFSGSALAAEMLRETEQACKEAAEKASESRVKAQLQRAAKLEADGQFERALQSYEEALRLLPDHEAAKDSATKLRKRLEDATEKTKAGAAKLEAGDPEAARTLAEESLTLVPGGMDATRLLAGARTALDEIERAADSFEERVAVERAQAQLDRYKRLAAKYAASKTCASLAERAEKIVETATAAAARQRIQAKIDAANNALQAGRLSEAQTALKEALEAAPGDGFVEGLLGKIADRRAAAASKSAEGRRAVTEGRHEDAVRLFEEALAADPEQTDAAAARDAANAEIERRRDNVRKLTAEAQQLDRARKPREAAAAWKRVLEADPTHAKAAEESARIDAFLVKADEAAARVRAVLESGDPDEAVAAAQEARAALGAWPEIEELQRAARAMADELEKGLRAIEKDIGGSNSGDMTQVAEAARALAAKFPKSEKARETASRAGSVADERRRTLAIAEVRRLVREHKFAEACDLAEKLRAEGVQSSDLAAAETQARRVVEEMRALNQQAAKARAEGRLDDAQAALARVIQILPEDAAVKAEVAALAEIDREYKVRLDGAETARRRGQLAPAMELYREALTINPSSKHATERLRDTEELNGRRAQMLGDCRQALVTGDGNRCAATAKQLIALCPDDDDARDLCTTGEAMHDIVGSLLAYARRQSDTGEHGAAKEALQCLLRVAPEHSEARQLLAKV